MINQNLSITERIVRSILGVIITLWAINQAEMNILEWVAAIAGVFLVLNAIFGRCYLWFWLNLDSCQQSYGDNCTNDSACN
ncbi:DUF2892 domain-containing protein [uncultured Oceanicoccus sp.]|uniref:YgaP family membrane protein n=1 Tax=uncultured Oceanicoccus sp. TaxID=1706381 RepID=UPI0030D6EB64